MPDTKPRRDDRLLSDYVYEQLFAALVDERLRPGDRINRRQVADDLGVSVAPVLEAMTQLEWEGYLVTKPRLGSLVRPVTPAHVLGRYRLRQGIEVEAARIYAGDRVRRVRGMLEDLARRVDSTSHATIASFQAEIDLHRTLVSLAECSVLDEAFAHVMRHSLYHAAIRFLPTSQRDRGFHVRFVADLSKADADQGERLVRQHLGPPMAALEEAARSADPDPLPSVRGEPVTLKRRARARN